MYIQISNSNNNNNTSTRSSRKTNEKKTKGKKNVTCAYAAIVGRHSGTLQYANGRHEKSLGTAGGTNKLSREAVVYYQRIIIGKRGITARRKNDKRQATDDDVWKANNNNISFCGRGTKNKQNLRR